MLERRILTLLAAIGCAAVIGPNPARGQGNELALKAKEVLKKHCAKCHGKEDNQADLDVLNYDLMAKNFLVPRDLDKSRIWVRTGIKGNMPPKSEKERPTEEEKKILKEWIEAGAPAYPAELIARPYVSQLDVLTAIRDDLRDVNKVPIAERQYQRYFTIANLHNNPRISEREIRHCRAGLSKAINSLSWNSRIYLPVPVGGDSQTAVIFRIDLRELGWDKPKLWQEILKVYPYGLDYTLDANPDLRAVAMDVNGLTNADLPFIRADWFIANATRPPLYHVMMYDEILPDLKARPKTRNASNPRSMTAYDLEKYLGINVNDNILKGKAARAGFARSNVSAQNRMVERHDGNTGGYWKSYDFKAKGAKADLFQFPLGPRFPGNPYERQAFEQDGGEIIFNLPNGLQAYVLINAKDERIDVGPTEVVGDPQKFSGTVEIINGLSCIVCHDQGMKRFADEIRLGHGLRPPLTDAVEKLYPAKERMDALLQEDEDRFIAAAKKATLTFLRGGDEQGADFNSFAEPVKVINDYYIRNVDAEMIACELDLYSVDPATRQKKLDVQQLLTVIQTNPRVQRLGMNTLLRGGNLKRENWDQSQGNSSFQQLANVFGHVPLHVQ